MPVLSETGWKRSEAMAFGRRLDNMRTAKPAVKLQNKKLVFVEPTLSAEVEYRAWTKDNQLRHASCKGLRKSPIIPKSMKSRDRSFQPKTAIRHRILF